MKNILLPLLIVLSGILHANSSEDLFDDWMRCKYGMITTGDIGKLAIKEHILNLLDRGTRDIQSMVMGVDSGADTISSKSGLYILAAELQGTAFRELTDYSKYESAIYDLTKEKQVDDEWIAKHSYWDYRKGTEQYKKENGSLGMYNEVEYQKVFPKREKRIENTYANEFKKDYAKKVDPYLYLVEREKKYWRLVKKNTTDGDDLDDLADFALNEIKNDYEPMWKVDK